MGKFVHLHVHTEYSLLDGANRIKKLVNYAKEIGMDSIAITDHGVMYGVIDFYKEAKKAGIKPIIGCEIYTSARSRFDKQPGIDSDIGHLVLLAVDLEGYKNLIKIVSVGFTEGFYYKPRVDFEILEKYSKGLIALSACISGDIPKAILTNNYEKAAEIARKYNGLFGQNNFFLELQINGISEQNLVNQGLIKLSKELNIPLIATNDAHYMKKEDARLHDILLCIQTGKNINDEDRMTFSTHEFYIKSPEEMYKLFEGVPEALANTVKVADRCNVEFEFNKLYLPDFKLPEGNDTYGYLEKQCLKGLYNIFGMNCDASLHDRLKFELSVIKQMGYTEYFLIVWDFIKYAKDNGIMVGPGRGSAAGSLVAYCLGITSVDPLKYNLLFERFLNPERISMPDIDIDFCFERRQEVIDYVIRKYGKDRVAQIVTFGTMAARGAVRDVGRALDISYSEVDRIAKMIPFQIGMNIEKALEISPEFKKCYDEDEKARELIDTARLVEGMPRHASTHAAGVVISKDPITDYVPLSKNDDSITTQFTMGLLEELGLLKMDFLGLRTLTVIRDTLEFVKQTCGKEIDIEKIDMTDKDVFSMISDGKTAGVFQLEGAGVTQFMKELQPSSFEDIIAGTALYRPGPMEQIPRYVRNKKNPSMITYQHPLLEKILNVTYGCMVYQEQVMQIVRDLAGYSMGRADLVRRAMSKKKVSVMEEERKNFVYGICDDAGNVSVKGAIRNGVDEAVANKIFDEMMDFASYAFNKSHAAAYAVIAYQTAFLKHYYPVEFMTALLNSFLGSTDKVVQYINECKLMNIEVLPPDINESNVKFSIVGVEKVRFGLAGVKNVGENAVGIIISERKQKGAFKGFRDFCERVGSKDVNKRCIESLIKSGSFDSFEIFRSRLIAVYEKMLDGINQSTKRNLQGQLSFFESVQIMDEKEGLKDIDETYPEIKEYSKKELLSMEKEMIGLYISGHPVSEFNEELKNIVTFYSSDLNRSSEESEDVFENGHKNIYDNMSVTIGGIITAKKTKTTKNNKIIAFITLEDMYGAMEVIVFSLMLEKYSKLLEEENVVVIKGRISMKEEEQTKIICEQVEGLKKEEMKKLYLMIEERLSDEAMASLTSLLKYFNGKTPVYLYNKFDDMVSIAGKDCWVDLDPTLLSELKERLGIDNVKVV